MEIVCKTCKIKTMEDCPHPKKNEIVCRASNSTYYNGLVYCPYYKIDNGKKTDAEKIEAYDRMVECGRKGGLAEKHFTAKSKDRQIKGAIRGGHNGLGKHKNFTPESLKKFSENGKMLCQKRWHGNELNTTK